jgi:alkylated DNA repair dioxygenase AlkB
VTIQSNLFEPATNLLEGFQYRPNVIDPQEEDSIIERVRELPFREFEFHGFLGKRRVVSFGWRYDYSGGGLRKAGNIPEFLLELRARAASLANLNPEAFQQVLVTEYAPGAGIGWHRDKPVFGEVVGISLLAPCLLRFRRKLNGSETLESKRKRQAKWERENVKVEPRSGYHLSGPARWEWYHSILRVDELRYAITFRSVK